MLLLAAVLAAAAWMIWHMWSIPLRTVPVQAVQAAAVVKNEPPTPVTTAPQVSPSVPAKSKPKLPFDEKSVMMPPEVRQEFDLACAVLGRAFTSGSAMALEGCVRHPEVTMPRVRALPASRGVLPVIPLEIGPKFGVTGELLLTTLRLKDGSHRPVVMEKKNGSYLLDWESLTGWCEATHPPFRQNGAAASPMLPIKCKSTLWCGEGHGSRAFASNRAKLPERFCPGESAASHHRRQSSRNSTRYSFHPARDGRHRARCTRLGAGGERRLHRMGNRQMKSGSCANDVTRS
jgi:hypothetical protein